MPQLEHLLLLSTTKSVRFSRAGGDLNSTKKTCEGITIPNQVGNDGSQTNLLNLIIKRIRYIVRATAACIIKGFRFC